MRKIYQYQTVRYFPHVLSDEFINVGVMLTSGKGMNRILTEDEAKHIYCSALIGEKKKFLGVVEYLNELSSDSRLLESNHYFHNFRFGEERKVASEKSEMEVVNELFNDYIGDKLQTEEKIDAKALILERSIKLAESPSFRKHVRVRTDESTPFDFEVESIKKQIIHHSVVGKTTLKHDVTRMVMATPDHKENKNRYDFLNMNGEINPENPYVKKLEHNFVDPYPYKTEEQIARYLEQIAS
ncbi:MAG: Unknown protein [uncultured Sulfurovum sp.]|uniref:DUF3037 domain-containing protein n=1 Tax=uncultured Sulfurovum sp. TaxID=269237 RepID=A0A6S6TM91_9BACT|nr:MAG: Unknown protein [uncultured Sulfurovum sp.]